MNKCFFMGKVIDISDYKFVYNSKIHNSVISFSICTLESIYFKSEIIKLIAYDNVADYVYRFYKNDDLVLCEGRLVKNMNIEVLYCLRIG